MPLLSVEPSPDSLIAFDDRCKQMGRAYYNAVTRAGDVRSPSNYGRSAIGIDLVPA